MKKHKFKIGDMGYTIDRADIVKVTITYIDEYGNILVKEDGRRHLYVVMPYSFHPTPEACAQALVDEFCINNQK